MSSQDARPSIDALLAHRAWVRGIARALVADESRVDDAEQETWLVAMERPPSRIESVTVWLRRVVRSRAFDAHRSESRRAAREQASARPEGLPATSDLVAKAEIQRDVAAAVCALPEPYRTAILLRHFEELEPREIAARLGVPVETVRTRIKRGHERLRELLDEEYGDRRAWLLLVVPLARRGRGIAAATAAGGALAMAGAKKLVAVAVLVLALAGGAWWAAETTSAPDGGASPKSPVVAAAASAVRANPETKAADESPVTETGTVVSVEVVDTAGRAVAGAHVALARPAPDVPGTDDYDEWLRAVAPTTSGAVRTAPASESGHAEIAGVAPGEWRLRVSAKAHADHEETLAVGAAPLSRRVVLRDACSLAGTVTRTDGSPAAGVVVIVVGSGRATTDAAGLYRLDALAAGEHDVRVASGDVVQRVATIHLPDIARLDIHLRGGCELTGVVVDDATGAPIAGARLRLFGFAVDDLPNWRQFVTTAVSGADGRFAMPDLPGGAVSELRAIHPEYAMNGRGLDWSAVQMHLALGYPASVTVRMARGASVAGRVVAQSGEPVAGATVELLTRAAANWIERSEPVVTDASGRFRARAVPGKGMARVRAPGFVQPGFPADPWTALRNDAIPPSCALVIDPNADAEIVIVLSPAPASRADGSLAGTVRRDDGAPLAGVLVELESVGSSADAMPVASVSAAGAFRFGSLAPGKYRLHASADGCAPLRIGGLVVPDTGALDGVDVVLPHERTISGRVLDDGGHPVADARVDAGLQSDSCAGSATSGADGAFVVRRLESGKWTLMVRAPGFARATVSGIDAGSDGVEVRLERAQSIEGVVVDAATGEPIVGMPVQASYATYRQGYALYREVATDAAGRFVVPDLTSETFTLWVGRPNDASSAAEYVGTSVPDLRGGATGVRVEMTRGLAIEGRVVDAANAPVSGGFVQAMGPKANPTTAALAVRGARIGRDGTFRLTGLATGAYDVVATPRTADGADAAPVRAADVQAGARDVVLRTEAGQYIAGKLLLDDGTPLPQGPGSVQVRWKNDLGGITFQEVSMMWSADGSFRVGPVEPGRVYDVVVSGVPGRLGGAVRGVKPGTMDVVVTVHDGKTISGRVVDASGAAVPAGVMVGAHSRSSGSWPPEPGQSSFAQTAADGTFTVTGLADAEYSLEAGGNPSDFIQARLDKPVSPGATGVEIRVERGATIAGRLVDAKGAALKGGRVEARGPSGYQLVSIDDQGRFAIHGLKPGTYALATKVGQRDVGLGDVPAPADGLVLTVREQ